ncbi:hypothetical protein [Micromonospora sp. NPDC051296]|uniref:hypothetical protein n=1 Tax=Micromonospora sp. NPDC051296 TaxID=3155046 RepID=UPI003419C995
MGEFAKRAGDVVASTAGGTVGPLVTALMATAAVVTRNPALAIASVPTGALADAMTEQGIQLVTRTLLGSAERVERFAEAVAEEAGQPVEDFIAEHVIDARDREFLGRMVDAATVARSDWKTRLLARAYVRGARDGDLVDETEMFVSVIRDLEPPHARFLAATYPLFVTGGGRPYTNAYQVAGVDKGLGPASSLLWRHLCERGIFKETTPERREEVDIFRITDLGVAVAEWLRELGLGLGISGQAAASEGRGAGT